MATSGPDLLVAAYRILADEEQDEAFERIHQLRVDKEAGTDSDMSRYLRSLRRVAEELGRTPTSDEYRLVQPQLVEAGEAVESFSRLYRFFGSWARAREALDLSSTPRNTPRRIEARFRERRLGKVWKYDEDDLRDALRRAAERWGHAPSTTEFDWWRERELQLARAAGKQDAHLPSVTPYRKRWDTWEAALLHFDFTPEEVARRLTAKNNIIRTDWDPDAMLPAGLAMAELTSDTATDRLSARQADDLRRAWSELPRRSRYVLTVRLGLAEFEALTLKQAAQPLALSLDRIRQLQLAAVEQLVDAVVGSDAADRGAARSDVEAALRQLAVAGKT